MTLIRQYLVHLKGQSTLSDPGQVWLTSELTTFTFSAVGETIDETFLGLEKLQLLLTDTLYCTFTTRLKTYC